MSYAFHRGVANLNSFLALGDFSEYLPPILLISSRLSNHGEAFFMAFEFQPATDFESDSLFLTTLNNFRSAFFDSKFHILFIQF